MALAEGLVSDLLPGRSSGGRGAGRLPDEVEAIVREVLRSRDLTRQRRFGGGGVPGDRAMLPGPGSAGALTGNSVTADRVAGPGAVDLSAGSDDAARSWRSAGGVPPEITGLLEQVQIDHTPVDIIVIIVVDDRHRLSIGRPYVTAGIDVCNRCVVGLVVTLEATSVGLCLAHMATDKRAWLERLGVDAVWPMSGKPRELYHTANETITPSSTRHAETTPT